MHCVIYIYNCLLFLEIPEWPFLCPQSLNPGHTAVAVRASTQGSRDQLSLRCLSDHDFIPFIYVGISTCRHFPFPLSRLICLLEALSSQLMHYTFPISAPLEMWYFLVSAPPNSTAPGSWVTGRHATSGDEDTDRHIDRQLSTLNPEETSDYVSMAHPEVFAYRPRRLRKMEHQRL